MKHNRLLGILIAVAMLLVANMSAMAQEYVLKYVTFLTPGEKGVVAVGMNNPDPVQVFQGKIILPEGLTFVTSSVSPSVPQAFHLYHLPPILNSLGCVAKFLA